MSFSSRLHAVGLGEQRLGLGQKLELEFEVRGELDVVLRIHLGLRRVEHVAGGLELRPERVVELLAARPAASTRRAGGGRRGCPPAPLRTSASRPLDELLLLGCAPPGARSRARRRTPCGGFRSWCGPRGIASTVRCPRSWAAAGRRPAASASGRRCSSRLALTCFHCAFAGSCAASVSASTTSGFALGERRATAAFASAVCFSVSSPTAPPRASRRALERRRGRRRRSRSRVSASGCRSLLATSAAGAPRLTRCSSSVTCPASSVYLRSK